MLTRSTRSPASADQAGTGKGAFTIARGSRAALAAHVLLAACGEAPPPPSSLYDDPALAAQVAENDGIDGMATRFTAFASGAPAHYWHLGERGAETMPAYRLCAGRDECQPIDHPPIVDRLPGDAGYSPYLRIHDVRVPVGFSGLLASFDDVARAAEAGTVEAPVARLLYWHCPIAAPDALVDVGGGATVGPERSVYVRGLEALCHDFTPATGPQPTLSDGAMIVRNVYVLWRDGESEPLSEAMRMADLTGDGDQVDSNNIFGVDRLAFDYTPLWRMVRVTVPAGYASIDTSGDDAVADYTRATQMFKVSPEYDIMPIPGRVVAHELTEVYIDCPLQSAEGSL